MDKKLLEKYARLLVKTGVNIQKNQILVVQSPVEVADFTRMVVELAYKEGAKDVQIFWKDELSTKMKYTYAPDEVFEEYPDWQKEFYNSYARKGAAFLNIYASDPELLKDIDPERVAKYQKVTNIALKEYRDRTMTNQNAWCIASVPTVAWAKKGLSGFT